MDDTWNRTLDSKDPLKLTEEEVGALSWMLRYFEENYAGHDERLKDTAKKLLARIPDHLMWK